MVQLARYDYAKREMIVANMISFYVLSDEIEFYRYVADAINHGLKRKPSKSSSWIKWEEASKGAKSCVACRDLVVVDSQASDCSEVVEEMLEKLMCEPTRNKSIPAVILAPAESFPNLTERQRTVFLSNDPSLEELQAAIKEVTKKERE